MAKKDVTSTEEILLGMAEVVCEAEGFIVCDDNVADCLDVGKAAFVAALRLAGARLPALEKPLNALITEVEYLSEKELDVHPVSA